MKLLDFKSIFDVDEFVIVMFFILFILYIIAYIVITKILNNKKLDIFLSVFFCIVLISLLSLFGELNLIDYIFGEGVSSIKNVNDKHVVFYYFLQKSLVYINILVILFSERNNIAKYLLDDAVD